MCGIFAYLGSGAPDPELLTAAAEGAGRRGPHGWGWAARLHDGTLQVERRLGPLSAHIATIKQQLSGRAILGHARLATMGDWQNLAELQPILVDGHALAHNGVIANPDDLCAGHLTDSIALAHAYAYLRRELTPEQAIEKLVTAAEQRAWVIAVLDAEGSLYVHRHYHPLWHLGRRGEAYLSSQPFCSGATPVPADRVIRIGR